MPPHPKKRKRSFLVEELEPRILYSADAVSLLRPDALAPPAAEVRVLDTPAAGAASGVTDSEVAAQPLRHEIVFVDTAVSGYQQLLAGLRADETRSVEAVLVDSSRDGVAQISEALAGRRDIDAIHIISHGADSALELGSTRLDFSGMLANAAAIRGWGNALSANADILLYGCDVAQDADGRAFVDALARLTGADVAASDDLTGKRALGGDWRLEYRDGHIETQLAFSGTALQDWIDLLNTGTAVTRASGDTAPNASNWNGTTFAAATNTASVGSLRVIEGAEAPTRDEKIVLGVDTGGAIAGEMWNGTTWSALSFSPIATATTSNNHGFDVAYESMSGDAIVVWNNGTTGTAGLSYRVWNGTSWSSAQTITTPVSGEPQQLYLVANPISNEMVLQVCNSGSDDYALVWNGTSWGQSVTLGTASGGTNFDSYVAYESQSGHAMAVYDDQVGGTGLYYRTWNGSTWSAATVLSAPGSIADDPNNITLAADPNSDRIALGVVTQSNEVWFDVWTGSAWGSHQLDASHAATSGTTLVAAVSFESQSGDLLATYAESSNLVRYRTWTNGGGWSAELSGPDIGSGQTPNVMTLVADPYSDTIMLAVQDSGSDLNYVAWSGTAWNTPTQIEINTGETATQPFLFLFDQDTPPVAVDDSASTQASTPVTIDVVANDSDPQGDTVTVLDVTNPANGTVTVSGGSVTYTPNGGFSGTDSFNYLATDSTDGLVHYWKLDGNGTDSVGTSNGTLTNGPVTVAGHYGNALDFDKTNDYVQIPDFTYSNSFSVSLWFKVDENAGSGQQYLYSHGGLGIQNSLNISIPEASWGTVSDRNKVITNFADSNDATGNGVLDFDISGIIGDGQWHLYTLSVASGVGSSTYLDGALMASSTRGGDAFNPTTNVFLGARADLNSNRFLGGQLDGVAVYSKGLNADQVARSYTGGSALGTVAVSVNAPPVIANLAGDTKAYAEGDGAVVIEQGGNATVTDATSPDFNGGTLTVSFAAGSDASEDVLAIRNQGTGAGQIGVSGSNVTYAGATIGTFTGGSGGTSLVITLNTNANASNAAALIRNITYQDTDTGSPTTTTRTVRYVLTDGDGGTSANYDATVTVSAVNDEPAGTNKTVTTLEDTDYTFTTADFGFTDPTDSPANALANVKIATLPGAGTLKLSGVAVTSGQFISAANITAGNLKFTPAANANGAGYASFTFQVQDDGGTANGGVDLDQSANTITVNVTSVNDAPAGTNKTVTTLEDTDYVFTTADFGFSDASDSPANALANVKITTLSGAGTLKLSGVAVTVGQFISAANINAGNLKLAPAANANGAGYASFTFQVQDDGGTANGGVDLDQSANTITVNVTSVNDAPAGTDKTVTTLEDTDYVFTTADFGLSDASDSPANALSNVKITTLPGAGTLKLSGVAVTTGQFISAANITAGNLKFTPAGNANGSGYASFTFQVQDDGGTANGGVDLDQSANTITVNATSVNDAPIGTNKTVTTLEDTDYVFTAADFGFTDPGDAAGAAGANALSNVKITTLPGAGTLKLSGVAVTTGQFVSVANINAGNLKFTPVANANGAGYASFTFQAQDDGGTANGGVDLDTAARTITVNVTSVNDAPAGTNKTVTTLEDAVYAFTAADFGFSDPGDSPVNALTAVKITTVPGAGTLALSGVAVSAGQFVSVANVNAGNLKFTPAANANGAGYASFTFQVQDDGGTANGGVDLDAAARTMTVNVTSVNDAPVGTNKTVTTLEDSVYTFTAADFGFTDPADAPANALTAVKITTLPGVGALALSGVAVTAGQFVSVANINAGNLKFTSAANANGAGYSSFTFQVQDDGGTANGGVDLDTAARTMTVNVTSVNDAPLGTDNTVTILEDTAYTFTVADFGFNDPNDSPANALLNVKITALPGAGSLTLSGVAVTNGQSISAAGIAAGNLRFAPAATANGAGYASFTFEVQDDGGTANGGVDIDTSPATITVNVTSVNDAPVGTNKTVSTLEDTAYTFTAADFGFTDPGDSPVNALAAVKITTAPGAGTLALSGVAVTAGQFVSVANINAGNLKFTPAANANGAGYASFAFQVQDNGGTANGGVDLDTAARTLTVNVTSVNDAPVGTSNTVTTLEDTAYTFTAADFGFTDPGDSPVNALLNVKITSPPGAGTLALSGVAVTAGQFVSVVNINAGNLKFTPAANANGAGYASFTFQVQDDGGTANGGADLDGSARTMTVNVTSVNDAPVGTSKTVTTLEDTVHTFTAADFGFTDPGDSPVNALTAVKITTVPGAGTLALSGVAVTAGQFVSVANINAGNLKFTPAANANGAGYASFTFQVQDDGGTANGGVDLDTAARTLTVNVTSVNDAPVGTNKTVTTLEDTVYTFTAADFGFTDPVDAPANALTAVRIATVPGAGALALSGVAVTAGQFVSVANINAGNLKFTPAANANGAGYASFTFQVQDGGGTTNGGVDLDTAARTITVDVTAVNDAPVNAVPGVQNTAKNTAVIFSTGNANAITVSDVDAGGNSIQLTLTVTHGTLTLAGVTGLSFTTGTGSGDASMVFTGAIADIDSALDGLTFDPDLNYFGLANLTVQSDDLGNTGAGGARIATNVVTINVDFVNSAPTLAGTNDLATINEDQAGNAGTLVSALVAGQITDPDPGALAGIAVTAVDNTNGAWEYSTNGGSSWNPFGSPAATTARLLAADANTYVRFVPNANWNGTAGGGLTFQAWDQTSGTAGATADATVNGGATAFSTASASASIIVNSVNDAPVGADNTVTTLEDTAYTFTAADFGFTDPSDAPANALTAVKITSLPGAGSLQNDGVNVTAGQVVSVADINAGKLMFTPTAHDNGAGYAAFTFKAQDDGGTANGGVDLDAAARTMTVDVTFVSDAPAGTSNTVTTLEDTAYTFTAADFGFTDLDDAPADVLTAVKITTLPGAGTLALSGVAVTAGQFVSVADINAGNLKFTPAANADGAGYASFTFQVQDDGGTANGGVDLDATPRTMTVDVTAVNDAPVGTSNTVTTLEDAAYTFTAADFGFTDPGDTPANALAAVKITTLPGAGSLQNNSSNVTAGQLVSLADINAGKLVFTPAANANGAGYATFTFQVQDNGGVANGGVDMDATPRTMAVNVTSVNNAPAGTSKTVATLEDTAYTFTAADFGFTDPTDAASAAGANALTAVKIATLPGAGTLQDNGVNVTAGQFVSLADINAGKLVFTPAANANGAGYASFTFQAQDDGGVANGGVNLDATPRTMTVNVTSVNDAPVGANNTVTTIEDIAYTFTAADFGFTDPTDAASVAGANALTDVRITTVPGAGTLQDNGVNVTAGQVVSLADINAGKLIFSPAANANGAGYASFTFQVQDNGGVANGGVDLDATPRTIVVNVDMANDAPLGTSNTVTALEDTAYTFTAADFGFTDPDDNPANAFLAVKVTTLPGAGTLQDNGANVAAGQFVSVADINAGKLVFTPAANANGAGYVSLTFQVRDDGGTVNGGVDLDATPRIMTVNVTSVSDAPAGTNRTVTTLEDTAYTFTAADFGFTDPADAASVAGANALTAVRITTLPGAGTLQDNGVNVVAGQFVSLADINAGKLVFTPAANASGAGYAAFTFQVQDDGGVANGGVDLDVTPRTMTVNVTSVNDAPAGASNTVATLEDTAHTFTAADFGFTDPADSPVNTLVNVKITTLPGAGTLQNNGVNVVAGQFVSLADLNAGNLKFTPAANADGAGYAAFSFQVQDDGGVANGGADLDGMPRTMTVNVTSVNDAPVGTSKTVATLEDTAYTFSAADFGFTDPTDAAGVAGANALTAVRITTLPGAGTLQDNGVNVTGGQFVSLADINSGKLVFTPAANANGAGYAAFTFQVRDDGGTVNGGSDLDATPRTMTISVTSVNDAPAGTNNPVTTLEDTAYAFTAADFGFTDPADSPVNALTAVKIATLPGAGTLQDNGVNVVAGQIVSLADINAGKLVFTPVANADGAGYASFTFQVQDDGGTVSGGVDLDATPRTMTVNVTSVNDAPEGTSNTVTTLEDAAYTFTAADFGFTDPTDAASVAGANALTAVKITVLPGAGTLQDNGVNVVAGQFVSLANVNAGKLVFMSAAHANGAGYAVFTFQVQDDGGTANAGVDLDATPRTMTVNVTSVNDAPVGTSNTVTTLEDIAYTFTAADFGFTDPVDSPLNALTAVEITTLPAAGSVANDFVAVTAGQFVSLADINAGKLIFIPAADANGAGYATFTFQVRDDGGTANGGIDLDATPRSMTVNVTSVNDAPVGADKTVTTLEDTTYTFTAADFAFNDPTDAASAAGANVLTAVRIATLPAAGTLQDNGVNVIAGQFVSLADINAGNLKFTPAVNANSAGYASFTFEVQDDGGIANAGVDLDAAPRTMTVNVTSINDAPAGTNKTITTLEDIAYTFTVADFGFSDPADAPVNALAAVRIATLPGAGALQDNGVNVVAGQFVALADINAGKLVFTPVAGQNGTGYASFTFQAQDDGGTANGGVDLDATPRTITVNVNSANNPPVGTSNTVTTLEDSAFTFTTADFGFTDPLDAPANALLNVKITTLPGAGSLTLSGVALTAGQFVSAASIDAGDLEFTPAANANGAGYAAFTFQVQDDGGSANSGVDLDQSANTLTIDVTAVNDAPALTSVALWVDEGQTVTLAPANVGVTDPDDASFTYTVSAVTGGYFQLTRAIGVPVTTFTSADLSGNLVQFVDDGDEVAPGFSVKVNDGEIDSNTLAATITYKSVNDASVGAPAIAGMVTVNQVLTADTGAIAGADGLGAFNYQWLRNDASIAGARSNTYTLAASAFIATGFGLANPADSMVNAPSAVSTTTLPGASTLAYDPGAVSAGQSVAPARTSREVAPPVEVGARAALAYDEPDTQQQQQEASYRRYVAGGAPVLGIVQRIDAFELQRLAWIEASMKSLAPDVRAPVMTAGTLSGATNSSIPNDTGQQQKEHEWFSVANGVRLTSVVMSVGVVSWAMRVTSLLASVIASAPAWRHLDPLPVLAPEEEKPDWKDDDGEMKQEEAAAARLLRGGGPGSSAS